MPDIAKAWLLQEIQIIRNIIEFFASHSYNEVQIAQIVKGRWKILECRSLKLLVQKGASCQTQIFIDAIMALHPEVLWAQRSSETDETKVSRHILETFSSFHSFLWFQNIVYVTVNLPDIHVDTLVYELTSTKLTFKAKAGRLVFISETSLSFVLTTRQRRNWIGQGVCVRD
jgi:hypothetical protein